MTDMRTTNIEYNINGIGVINPFVYVYTNSLLNEKSLGIEVKMKSISQLGAIKYLHQGAHYTRYEYLLLQFTLVHFIKDNSSLALSQKLNIQDLEEGFQIEKMNDITRGDFIELIALLGNIGHFKDTFSSNKVWFHFLYSNKLNFKSKLKKGMNKKSNALLEVILNEGGSYEIQWINTLYILSRSKKLEEYLKICEVILNKVLSKEKNKWLDLYRKIRKVSYVVLDTNFSHIPIFVSLQSVLFNADLFVDELEKQDSGLMSTFDRISILLEDTLYSENNVLLMSTYRSFEIYSLIEDFYKDTKDTKDIAFMNKLLMDTKVSPFYSDFSILDKDIPWDRRKNLSITYMPKSKEFFPTDVFQEELDRRKRLGKNCFVGFGFSPDFYKYRTVYAIKKDLSKSLKIKESIKIIRESLRDYLSYKNHSKTQTTNGDLKEVVLKKVITFLFRNILENDYYCEFQREESPPCFIIGRGRKTVIDELDQYISKYGMKYPNEKNKLHELNTLRKTLDEMSYNGLIVVYAGSLSFIDNSDKQAVCEIDGLIMTPNSNEILLKVVEAKNVRQHQRRVNEASKQLEEKFLPLLSQELKNIAIVPIEKYGAEVNVRPC